MPCTTRSLPPVSRCSGLARRPLLCHARRVAQELVRGPTSCHPRRTSIQKGTRGEYGRARISSMRRSSKSLRERHLDAHLGRSSLCRWALSPPAKFLRHARCWCRRPIHTLYISARFSDRQQRLDSGRSSRTQDVHARSGTGARRHLARPNQFRPAMTLDANSFASQPCELEEMRTVQHRSQPQGPRGILRVTSRFGSNKQLRVVLPAKPASAATCRLLEDPLEELFAGLPTC